MRALLPGTLVATLVATLAAQPPDRTRPPGPGAPPVLKLPAAQKRALSNGLPVWLIETHEVPIAQLSLVVGAGAGDDPSGKYGVASFTVAMLDEGAGSRSALEIADAVDFLGADLATTSTFDASAVRLNVPVTRLADALPIMADVALRPTFPVQDLERMRQERLTAILQAQDDPRSIATVAFNRIVFGPAHRYGTSAMGTETAIRAFTPADLRAFHSAYFSPANAALIVVGAVQADAVMPLLEEHFGAWKGQPVTRVPVPAAPQRTSRQIYLVDKPGAAQSQIRIGYVGVPRSTPDFFTLEVLNTVFGGSFTSRLNTNLRETHGYAYGASSSFDMRLSAGPFQAAAGVQSDKTAEALREFFKEFDGVLKPIPRDELTRAKNYMALGFPSEFETTGDLSRKTEEQIVYELPEGYFEGYIANALAVSPEAVSKMANIYIQPSKLAVLVVGDRKAIEAPIRALNLAPITVMTVAEAFGR